MAFAPTIHSIGDATFLAQVLNAVAMIMGTNDFVRLVSIGLLLGVLVIVLQGLFRGAREIAWQQLLLGWIIYACMFVPTTTVIIEDSYTGKARPVDNVPIGVAFAGSMISNIGYGITVLFETAYSDVASSTERPFVEPLMIVNALRAHASDEEVINRLNHAVGAGTDMGKTLENYIKECSMPKLALRVTTPNEMITGNAIEQLEFNSNIYGTRIFLNNAAGENLTCKDAWTKIKVALEKSKDPTVISAISSAANIKGEAGFANIDDYGSAFEALNIDSTQIEQFILTSVIKPIYEKAAMGYFKSVGDRTSAVMFNQAVMQRNTQWATEASMFMTVVRPFLSFFEGFMFAITPVLAFLLVLGGMGISLGMKYVMLILWIQLWMPVLSIINLYIIMSARGALATETFTSFYSIDNCALQIEHWIATGGMLAAATPLISLFLITGSTFAFTSLTQRMAGGDHINEKLHSPDVMTKGAFYAHDSAGNGNSLLGARRTGAEGTFGDVTVAEVNSRAMSSARSKMEATSNSLSNAYSRSFATGKGINETAAVSRAIGESLQSSNNRAIQSLNEGVRNLAEKYGWNDQQQQQALDQVSLSMSAGMGLPKVLSLGFSSNTGTTETDGVTKSVQLSEEDQHTLNQSLGTTTGAQIADGRSATLSQQDGKTWLKNAGVSDQSDVGKSFLSNHSAAKNFQDVSMQQSSVEFAKGADMLQLSAFLGDAQGGNAQFGTIANSYQGTALEQRANQITKQLTSESRAINPTHARKIGLLTALGESGNAVDRTNFLSLVNTALGTNSGNLGNAQEYQGIAPNVQQPTSNGLPNEATIRQEAQQANEVPHQINNMGTKLGSSPDKIDIAKGNVTGHHISGIQNTLNDHKRTESNWKSQAVTKARDGLTRPVEGLEVSRRYQGTNEQLMADSVQAGLTDGQTMAAIYQQNSQPELARKVLAEENQRLYGHEMSKEEISSLTADMHRQINGALSSGDHYRTGLTNVVNWNRTQTDLGGTTLKENTLRLTRMNEQNNQAPTDLISPNNQEKLNRMRGLASNAHIPPSQRATYKPSDKTPEEVVSENKKNNEPLLKKDYNTYNDI